MNNFIVNNQNNLISATVPSILMDQVEPLFDDWDDDDDNGYVIITISTEEFFEIEEVRYI